MENSENLRNRQAQGPKPTGRPSAESLATRSPATPVEAVKLRKIIIEDGIVCVVCDQAMHPFVIKTVGNLKYLECSKCRQTMVLDSIANTVRKY